MRSFSPRIAFALLLTSLLQIVIFPVAGPLPPWRAALSWFALVPLLWVVLGAGRSWTLWQKSLAGYCCGSLWYLGTCYWVYDTMHQYGGLPVPVAMLAMLLFCLYLGLYHALFAFLLGLAGRLGTGYALFATPFLWTAVELARARVTSFPWNLLGYSQIDNSVLTHMAPFTGVYGLGFLLAAVNAAIALAAVSPRSRTTVRVALVAAVVATGVQNFGAWIVPAHPLGSQTAVMLQPNLDVQGEKENPAEAARSSALLSVQAAALDARPVRVVLWPESPSPFQTDGADFMRTGATLAAGMNAPLIAGTIGIDAASDLTRGYRIYNSAELFDPVRGPSARYDKIHLVPFGEFVPYARFFRFASGLTQAVGLFDRGQSRMPLRSQGHGYGVFLCYESIFGDEVRQQVLNGADVLTNLSDDGWYGDTSAPFQHINMARMRAIENSRWVLRDTNNGITAAINPDGRVVEAMARHQRGAAALHFDYRTDLTFYTLHGDVFAYCCTAIALLLLAFSFRKTGAA